MSCRATNTEPGTIGSTTAVVIPVYARTLVSIQRLVNTVAQLRQQSRPPNLIILVDDCGPVPVPNKAANGQVQVLRLKQNCGPATARNCGLAAAKQAGAVVVCFLDADCTPERGWVEAMQQAQLSNPGIVCGQTMAEQPNTAIGIYHNVCGTLNGRMGADGSVLYGCTCNLSIAVQSVALAFDSSFPGAAFEDVDFCVRAKKTSISLTYARTAVVKHDYEAGIRDLFVRFQRYGAFESTMARKHPEYLSWLWSSTEISCHPVRWR